MEEHQGEPSGFHAHIQSRNGFLRIVARHSRSRIEGILPIRLADDWMCATIQV